MHTRSLLIVILLKRKNTIYDKPLLMRKSLNQFTSFLSQIKRNKRALHPITRRWEIEKFCKKREILHALDSSVFGTFKTHDRHQTSCGLCWEWLRGWGKLVSHSLPFCVFQCDSNLAHFSSHPPGAGVRAGAALQAVLRKGHGHTPREAAGRAGLATQSLHRG